MQQPPSTHYKKRLGAYGESIAAKFLMERGYVVIARNYWKPWGEIDLVAKKEGHIHFIEVKTVSYETKSELERAISHGTWRPEENVHAFKLRKLTRVIETWLIDCNWEGSWQIDVVAVRCVPRETYATVKHIPNVIVS